MTGSASRTSDNTEWTRRFVGRPWASASYGPEAFDCWGLVHAVYLYRLGIDLPRHPGLHDIGRGCVASLIREHAAGGKWASIERPADLCVVAMGMRVVDHVGVYLASGGGLVLHSGSTFGVVLQPLAAIRSRFSVVRFYELD